MGYMLLHKPSPGGQNRYGFLRPGKVLSLRFSGYFLHLDNPFFQARTCALILSETVMITLVFWYRVPATVCTGGWELVPGYRDEDGVVSIDEEEVS